MIQILTYFIIPDAEFDSYWDYEAKNKNRNRIRVGRQYQATVPPLLKPGFVLL